MRPVFIVDGVRTPFVKSGSEFADVPARELGRAALRELIDRTAVDPATLDEVIVGNVAGPADATNVARVISLLAGVPEAVPAFTVNRNCASGLQSVADAALRIAAGQAELIVAGGTESMSMVPVFYPESFKKKLFEMSRTRTPMARASKALSLRPGDFSPVIALEVGLTDDTCGLNMGQTAEVLAREFGITREAQDRFALRSHKRATAALEQGRLAPEIAPFPVPPDFKQIVSRDQGPRRNQTLEKLAALKPHFDRTYGTVTVGNSCQVTDGAAMLLLASEEAAERLGRPILGRVRSWAFAGLDPSHMGLGPAHAVPKALEKAGVRLSDIELIEFNEAFAAQVLANAAAFDSVKFAERNLGRSQPIGTLDFDRINVNGGAIALGHPVGATGSRLILTLLKEMSRRHLGLGLVTLCVGGGQGAAMVLERTS
ncbi:MAG: thiolase family protein [Candidatus Eisenbacteria bacterium]|nr:thiolase family protein [Candidatus Eisenbacteria bacterium]